MFSRFVYALAIGAASPVVLADDSAHFFTRAESFSDSNAAPLTAYLKNLVGPVPDRGDYVLSRNSIEFGMAWKEWELSFIHRNDYNLRFHEETMDFAYMNNNRVPRPQDQDFRVEAIANQYQLTGFKLGHKYFLPNNFSLFVAASYLYATESVSGSMGKSEDGTGGVVRETTVEDPFTGELIRTLEGNIHADYFFTDDPLFERSVSAPSGHGYSVDIGLDWQAKDNLLFELKISDALAKVYWKDLPHTIADATSETFVEDEDGIWQATPNFEGWEIEDDFTQDLTLRTRLNVHYDINKYYFGYAYDRMELADYNYLIAGYHFSDRWGMKVGVELRTAALSLTLLAPIGDFYFTFDELDIDNAHTIGFGWSVGL